MPIQEEQTAHSQHAVPQNIMSVEFKLVGDLTVRQFVYLVVGGITVYLSFISNLSFLWKWSLILVGGLGSLALAFVPLGDRGLDQWIKNFVKSITTPTQRVWKKSPEPPQFFLSDYAKLLKSEVVALAPAKSRKALSDYLETIEKSTLTELDFKEQEQLNKLNYNLELPSTLKSMVSVSAPPKTEEAEAYEYIVPPEPKKEKKHEDIEGREEKKKKEKEPDYSKLTKLPKELVSNVSVGRVLRHIPLEGEIILPKKERSTKKPAVLEVTRKEISTDASKEDIFKKAEELRKAFKRAKERLSPEGAVLPARELFIEENKGFSNTINTLKEENKKLAREMQGLKSQMATLDKTNKNYKERVSEYEEKINELLKKRELVEKTIGGKSPSPPKKEEVTTPKDDQKEDAKKQAYKEVEKALSKELQQAERAKSKKAAEEKPKESQVPNVIWGTVKDSNGHLLENATIIIRDINNDPVRALKTNKLGQFITATPLENGQYKLEILNKEFSFDIMNVNLNGSVLKPIEFQAKK